MTDEYSKEGEEILEALAKADNFTAWLYGELRPFISGAILEIGSGAGSYSEKIAKDFPGNKLVLSDIDAGFLQRLSEKRPGQDNVSLARLDISSPEDFKKIGMTFDTAIAINVLEHIADDAAALKNIHSCLNDGGRFIVLVPAHRFLYNTVDQAIGHYRRYTRPELADKAAAAGFRVQKLFYFNFLSIFGWYLNGNLLRKRTIDDKFLRIFNFFVPVIKFLEKNILRGRFGISLVAVLEKAAPAGDK